jgi:hypothetical protein
MSSPFDHIPLRHPSQAGHIDPMLTDRIAVVAIDVRATGFTWFQDFTPNTFSRPYRIALFTSLLDDQNRLVPYDKIDFRIAVPGYMTLDKNLVDLMVRLRDVAYRQGSIEDHEKARQAAQEHLALEFIDAYPVKEVPLAQYDPDKLDEGLSAQDASQVLSAYLLRFAERGAILAGQDLRLIYTMCERIGMPIDALPTVYSRPIQLYTALLMVAMSQGTLSGMMAMPSIGEFFELPEAARSDALLNTQLITGFLLQLGGAGSIPGELYLFENAYTVSEGAPVEIPLGNHGMTPIEVRLSVEGVGFDVSAETLALPSGAIGHVTVSFAGEEPADGELHILDADDELHTIALHGLPSAGQ